MLKKREKYKQKGVNQSKKIKIDYLIWFMRNKKIYIVIMLFSILGLTAFTFSNSSEEELGEVQNVCKSDFDYDKVKGRWVRKNNYWYY